MLPLIKVIVGASSLKMTRRRLRESMQALLDNHFDPTKEEELKHSKTEIENKLPKIVKFVKERRLNRRNRNTEFLLRKESEVIELIEDFHKQYQFVYNLYDHLKGRLSQTVNGIKEEEGNFTATSSSDSESENDFDKGENHREVEDLKQDLIHVGEEKDSLNSEYMQVRSEVKVSQKILLRLEEESARLRKRLAEKEQEISSLAQMHKLRQTETLALINRLESDLSTLNIELGSLRSKKRELGDQIEDKILQNHASCLANIEKDMDRKLFPLLNGVDKVENGLVTKVFKMTGLIAQVNDLKLNVNCLNLQKSDSALHENLSDQLNKMKRDMGYMRKKNTELESIIKKKDQEKSNFLFQMEDLKKKLASQVVDIERIQKEKDDSRVRIEELESELQNLHNLRSETEKQNGHLKWEEEELQAKMFKMERIIKERDDQFPALQKQVEDGKENKSAHIVALANQINHLEEELELRNEHKQQIKIKNQDIVKLIEEKELLQVRILELEKKLEDRHNEFSNLQNKMSSQIVALTREVSQLQKETYTKHKLDEQISSQEMEISQLREESESLQDELLELEVDLTEREDKIATLHTRLQITENEKASLSAQIDHLEKELSSEKQQFLKRLTHVENKNNELNLKISDQHLIILQQEDAMMKLRQDSKLIKGRFLQAADRKMDELTGEFRKSFEDSLRILSRRIRVAEQLQAENKDNFKTLKDRCKVEHPGLEKRLLELRSSRKADLEKISDAVSEMMKTMEAVICDFDSKEGSFLQRLSRVSEEVQVTKNWVRWTMDEMKPWKNDLVASLMVTMDEKEQEKVMEEKISMLEAKLKKAMGDKLRLMRGMHDLQKKVGELEKAVLEKDEGLLRIREEKMEAIRQLCLWIDYHQSRFDGVKEMLLMKRTKGKGGN